MFQSCIQFLPYPLPHNNHLYIKREDLLPFSFGGNKVRIAEEFVSDMRNKKKNLMIGYGNSRSNLCRVLANICFRENIPVWIISPSDDDSMRIQTFNSFLVEKFNARIITCEKNKVSETVQSVFEEAESQGYSYYYTNGDCFGKGNEATPVTAYIKVYNEILQQQRQQNITFHSIFLPTGTGMTQAGLVCGRIISGQNEQLSIIGCSIARTVDNAVKYTENYIKAYFKTCNYHVVPGNLISIVDASCGGYGQSSVAVDKIIWELLQNYGIALDPVYSGKAFLGMLNYLENTNISNQNILFIHTGSAPLFFNWLKERM